MTQPLELSVSTATELRWPGLSKIIDGALADIRSLYTVRFQLLVPGATAFGSWTNGSWETNAPPEGPYAATITVGAGQPAPVNPGVAALFVMWGQFVALDGSEDPPFRTGPVKFNLP